MSLSYIYYSNVKKVNNIFILKSIFKTGWLPGELIHEFIFSQIKYLILEHLCYYVHSII